MSAEDVAVARRGPRAGGTAGRLVLALAVAAIVAGSVAAGLSGADPFTILGEHRGSLVAWAEAHLFTAAALYLAAHVLVIVLSLPGAFALTAAGGFLFGLLGGAALAVAASTLGGLVVFLAARTALGEPIRRWILSGSWGGSFERLERGVRENAILYLLLLRLLPAVPFTVANVAPAFFGVSVRVFVATTIVGVMPASAILASAGAGLGEVFDRGDRPDMGLLAEPAVAGPLLALAALSVLPLAARRLRRAPR